MGVKRPIDVDFWTDRKVIEMFSPEDKLFFLYLLTNPHTTQLGIYEISPVQMAFEIGYSVDAIRVLLDRFENKYHLIRFSQETSEVAVKNALRHNIVKGGKPVEDCIIKEISKVKDHRLLKYIHEALCRADNLNQSVKKILPLLILNDNVNDNVNDNDNERIVDDSCCDSSIQHQLPNYLHESNNEKHVDLTGINSVEELKQYLRGQI